MDILKGQRLRTGDLIGLVTPASPMADSSRIELGVRYLESLGYRTLPGRSIGATCGYLAGSDTERAADLHSMFSNREVKAIMCIRGGYGSPRLLGLLDYRLIARNPKIFVGYSDITALHLALWKKVHLVTFHGPMVGVDLAGPLDAYSETMFWSVLTSRKRLGRISLPPEGPSVLKAGRATGRMLGGNLALITALTGTPYLPDFSDALLYIEDISEEPYRVDRMLTQLHHARILSRSKAILAGGFTDCVPHDPSVPSQSVDEILREIADKSGKPFLANLPFGHQSPKMTLPVGLRARVDAGAKQIEFLEAAVR